MPFHSPAVFDDIRHAFRELLHGNVPPEGRRELIAVMKDTLVQAKLALDDLREGVDITRKRVAQETMELETIRRRKGLAQNVNDAETVTIAERFEQQQAERLSVLVTALNLDIGDKIWWPSKLAKRSGDTPPPGSATEEDKVLV